MADLGGEMEREKRRGREGEGPPPFANSWIRPWTLNAAANDDCRSLPDGTTRGIRVTTRTVRICQFLQENCAKNEADMAVGSVLFAVLTYITMLWVYSQL